MNSKHTKIRLAILMVFVATLPFSIRLNSISIILFIIQWIIEGNWKTKWRILANSHIAWLWIAFFLLHIIGLSYTHNIKEGIFDLEKKLSLLIFPIVVGTSSLSKKEANIVLLAFVATCFIGSSVGLSSAILNTVKYGVDFSAFSNELSFFMHRVYLSMYLMFCINILLYFLLYVNARKHKIWILIFISYFSIFIVMLASRMMLIVFFMNGIALTFYYLLFKRKILFGLISLIFIMVVLISILTMERTRNVMKEIYTNLDKGNSDANFSGPNQRVIQWQCAVSIIQENFLLGVGTGDTEDALYEKYVARQFKWGIQNRYNAHNQLLQTWLGLGVIGGLLYLLVFIVPFCIAYKNKNFLYMSFLFLFFMACLSECMLCAQKGVVFFAFFNALLAFHVSPRQE